jgi:hypothetical protein
MRLDSNYVRLHIVQQLTKAPFAKVRYDDFDVIVIDLPDGQAAAICLMERETPLNEIVSVFQDHARQHIHTVFILWCEMHLPEHGDIFEPPEWMLGLYTLQHRQLYAYKTIGDEVYIYPIQFERIGYGKERLVKYGQPLDVRDLGCAVVEITGEKLQGRWLMADFLHGRGHAHTQRVYRDRMERERRQRKHQRQQQTPVSPQSDKLAVYYRILGLSSGAKVEEIRKAYRILARQYHPDLNPASGSTEKMQHLNAAYRHLMRLLEDENVA